MTSINDILPFLKSIEAGEITLDFLGDARDYSAFMEYRASNGWSMTVFNDASDWDYIQGITAADGTVFDENALAANAEIALYKPPKNILLEVYRWGW